MLTECAGRKNAAIRFLLSKSNYGCTVNFAAGAATPTTVTTTCCTPGGTEFGTVKFTCVRPTTPGVIPTNCRNACTPPTVTVSGRRGFGSAVNAVFAAG